MHLETMGATSVPLARHGVGQRAAFLDKHALNNEISDNSRSIVNVATGFKNQSAIAAHQHEKTSWTTEGYTAPLASDPSFTGNNPQRYSSSGGDRHAGGSSFGGGSSSGGCGGSW